MENNENQKKDQLSVQANILEAAESVFAQKGYAGTRISEIAERAKVNQALVHYYYENKEKLYQAVLAPLIEKWQQYVLNTQWIGDNPKQILRQFIYTHCAYHFRYPNLYKLSKWEELEGKNLFATPFFDNDVKDKITALSAWQKNGQLQPALNVNTLLYLIWGMIQQFYSKSPEELAFLLKSGGEPQKLQLEVAEQITEIVLNGAFTRSSEKNEWNNTQPKNDTIPVSVWIPPHALPQNQDAADVIWDQLAKYPDLNLTRLIRIQEFKEASDRIRGAVLLVQSEYGEMPDWLVELIQEWTADPSAIAGLCVAVWVFGNSPASMLLQKMIEEHINRLGGYTFPRTHEQIEQDYMKRFHKLVSSMG